MFGRYKTTSGSTTRPGKPARHPKPRRSRGRKPSRQNRRFALEQFESKQMLTTFVVTSDLDTGAVGELRWAVDSANAVAGADIIEFDGSVSNINLTLGELVITDDLTIGDAATDPLPVTIDAGDNSRIFRVNDGNLANDIVVSMAHLNLQNGDVTSTGEQGGAILNTEDLSIFNSTVASSRAVTGGGIANLSSITLNSVRVIENVSRNGGGGIWNSSSGVATIEGGGISNNEAQLGPGGGILNDGGRLGVFPTSEFIGNTASRNGGGIAVQNGGIARVEGTTFSANRRLAGGGISGTGSGTVIVSQSNILSDNSAVRGGGFAFNDQAEGSILQNIVSSNLAQIGGGGGFVNGQADVQVVESEISSNQAGTDAVRGTGAGLGVGDATLLVQQSNIAFNGLGPIITDVAAGGGIFAGNEAQITIEETSISGNAAISGAGIFASPIVEALPVDSLRTSVSISDSQIFENNSVGPGGGIFVGPNTDLHLKCVELTQNSSAQDSGGAIKLVGRTGQFNVDAQIVDSTISGNAALTNGGGISSEGAVGMQIDNTIVSQNLSSAIGGGLHLSSTSPLSDNINSTRISNSLISGNEAGLTPGVGSGGGIFVGANTETVVETTTISRNAAVSYGGGITVSENRSFTLVDSTVSGNRSNRGGGLALLNSRAIVSQDTFYANTANIHGGGIFVQSSGNQANRIAHTTISANRAGASGSGRGGGIYISDAAGSAFTVDLANSIVSDNTGTTVSGFDEIFDQSATSTPASVLTSQFSLIRDNNGIALAAGNPAASGNLIGSVANPISAELGPLSDNGGLTLTMVPMDFSPAIDAGDPLFASPPAGDQRQLPFKRVFNSRIDMGAIEVQPPPATPDFDGDGDADLVDIDALVADIASGANNLEFELTGDEIVNRADLVKWLDDAPDVNGIAVKRYLFGDANLDLSVDVTDFNIWNANKFSAVAAWSQGDFTADGFVDASDFNIWNANKFTSSLPLCECGLRGMIRADGLEQAASIFEINPAEDLTNENSLPTVNGADANRSFVPTGLSSFEADKDSNEEQGRQLLVQLDKVLADW